MNELASEKTVYLVRHGESDANALPVFSTPDSALSQKGKEQAEVIAERISKLSFEALIVSPYLRTRETAQAITRKTGIEPEYCNLFEEAVMPEGLPGKPYDDEDADKLWKQWEKSLFTSGLKVPGGEGLDELMARAGEALAYLERRPERSLVVVSHGYFIRMLVMRVLLGDLLTDQIAERFKRLEANANTALTVLRFKSDPDFEDGACWRVWIYNDHAHIG